MSAAAIAQKQNYFAPSTTAKAGSSPKDGSRDVTHPPIPELLDPAYLDKLFPSKPPAAETGPSVTATQTGAEAGAAFMAALKAEGNKQYTQNSAHAFESTGNAVVDAFNGLSQATDPADFEPVLRRSWAVDPLLTVKLIFNLRSIHEGKSEREGFYRAWGWLYRNHPRTAVSNLSALVDPLIEKKLKESKKNKDDKDAKVEEDEDLVLLELEDEIEPRGLSHGYWKDLLNLLTLATEGQLDEGASQFEALHPNRQTRINARLAKGRRVPTQKVKTVNRARGHIQHTKGSKDPQTHDARVAASLQRDAEASDKAKTARQSKAASWRERVQKLLTESKPYKAL